MLKSKKQLMILLSILLIILIIINVWYFLAREWESSFYPTSYATLYYPTDIPKIQKWERKSKHELQVKLAWNKKVEKWRILSDGENQQIGYGMNPTFKIFNDEGKYHEYTLTPLPEGMGPDIKLNITFYSKEFYKQRGMNHTDIYTIQTNVPSGKFKQYPVSYWVDDYSYVGEKELQKANRILHDEVGIQDNSPTFKKMEKLARYLRIKLKNARGVPKDDFRWMNPWLIYQEIVNGTGKGWCTQHGQICVFFANRAGIPTRLLLGALTQGNHFVYSGHTWAESYIREQNRWAFVDLSHSHIYITDKKGLVLNTAELFHLNQHDAFDSTFARIYKDWEWSELPEKTGTDSIVTVSFAKCNKVVKNEFSALSIIKFRRPPNVEDIRTIYSAFFKDSAYLWGNLERYLFKPPLTYSFYPTDGKRTYFIRWVLFFSLIIVFIFWIISLLVLKFKEEIMIRSSKYFGFTIVLFCQFINLSFAQPNLLPAGVLDNLSTLKDYQSKRISSYDKSGNNEDRLVIQAGETRTIAEIKGAGIIKPIWITIACQDPMIRRNAILRMYWDDEKHPSIESPVGDFFGQGWGENYNFISLPLAAAPSGVRALNCYFPMPFGKGAKITIENQSDVEIRSFYYYIDYEQHKSIPDNLGRFHAWWHRELTEPATPEEGENEWDTLGEHSPNPTGDENYVFADIIGKGHFVGVNYYVDSPTPMWYGEGDDMFFIDGEPWPPSLHGTGTEDFFNSSWCPKELYTHPYFGYARVNNETGFLGRTHCYHFFLESPIAFNKSLKATIEHGHNNCLTLDLVTVSYWYQIEPHHPFPALAPKEKRQNMIQIGSYQIHRWRDAWLKKLGEGVLWGDEWKEK